MPDLVQWVFRSPARLISVVVAVVVLLAVLSLLGRDDRSGRATAGAGDRGTTPPAAQSLPAAQPFLDAAVRFARAWASVPPGGSAEQWRASLVPLVTADLARGLALTDVATLPQAEPSGAPELRFLSSASALVRVRLADGSAILVTVVDDAGTRRVSDVQPDEGDDGLGGAPSASASAGAGAAGAGSA